ncbi:hypothetical protein [Spirosoma sp. KNUC1025]|uniref:hypothetical protein n=1 Tax=Spirosoma sp. KNUC1025 TaxID=2894082 RepID=UPI003866A576|nr:hypothetical protein LN737_19440 [Spirosoma sp. KNUC1025]
MTADELDTLPGGTKIYLPVEWFVKDWVFVGRVGETNYFTVLHPPDAQGDVPNKRPVYFHALDLLPAALDEQIAWLQVISWMEERKSWIYQQKLAAVYK